MAISSFGKQQASKQPEHGMAVGHDNPTCSGVWLVTRRQSRPLAPVRFVQQYRPQTSSAAGFAVSKVHELQKCADSSLGS